MNTIFTLSSLETLPVASEELLSQRALQKRVDSKFILHERALEPLFFHLSQDYAIVLSNKNRIARYQNTYFDTAEYLFLREHHRGRRPRYKIRIRHYPDRELSFLECKKKLSLIRTGKSLL